MKVSIKERLFYSKKFIEKIENIVEEDGYQYRVILSNTSKDLYSGNDNQIISNHITHVTMDYQEDGLELVIANGYIKDGMVIAELLMRKAVDIRDEAYSN